MGGNASVHSAPRVLPIGYRVALVLPLAYGVYLALHHFGRWLGEPGVGAYFYLVSAAFYLLPCVLYAVGGVLVMRAGPHRRAWFVLLACGAATCVWLVIASLSLGIKVSGVFDYASFVLEPVVVLVYLLVLAGAHLMHSPSRLG